MHEDWLKRRFEEMTALADTRKLDWRQATEEIDYGDYQFRVGALATLLELNLDDVFDPHFSIKEVDERSEKWRKWRMSQPSTTNQDTKQEKTR